MGEGSSVNHPKYGRGTVVRKEGEGDDAKLTVMFPGHGLKKIIAKFAGFTNNE
jgi:DNA helicase-2/ATP-dependent DNA helicase PcrA